MITSWIAWLPALAAIWFCIVYSPQRALYTIYIPILLLLPAIFVARTYGFPQLTFHQTTIIPITIAALFFESRRWRWSLIDLCIIGLIILGTYSETINEDTHEGINRLANLLCNIGGPYIAGKMLIHSKQLTVPISKRIVFLMCVNIILGLYELRMTSVLQVFITNLFFPDQNAWDWPPLYRYGFVRMNGPFMTPIFFGIAVTFALLLQYWLIKSKLASRKYKYLTMGILVFGLVMTFSRGPWLAALLAFFLAGAAFSKHLRKSLFFRFSVVCGCAFILFQFFLNYQSIPTSETEGTILYRANLWEKYQALIMEKFWFGWGIKNFPKESGMASIDNQYLFLWILNGFTALLFFLWILLWGSVRLIRKGILSVRKAPLTSSLSLIFFSIFAMFAIVFSTVYMGLQIEPLFYLFVGWSEGFILARPSASSSPESSRTLAI